MAQPQSTGQSSASLSITTLHFYFLPNVYPSTLLKLVTDRGNVQFSYVTLFTSSRMVVQDVQFLYIYHNIFMPWLLMSSILP